MLSRARIARRPPWRLAGRVRRNARHRARLIDHEHHRERWLFLFLLEAARSAAEHPRPASCNNRRGPKLFSEPIMTRPPPRSVTYRLTICICRCVSDSGRQIGQDDGVETRHFFQRFRKAIAAADFDFNSCSRSMRANERSCSGFSWIARIAAGRGRSRCTMRGC